MPPNDMTRFNVGFFWFAAVQFGLVGLVALWVVEPWVGSVAIAFAAAFALGAGSSRRQGEYDRELQRGGISPGQSWPARRGFWGLLAVAGVLVLGLVTAALAELLWLATLLGAVAVPVGYLCGRRTPIASRERQERVDEHIAADPWLSPGGSALQGLAICLLLIVGAFAVMSFVYGDWLVGAVAAVVFLAAAVGAAVGLRVWGRRWRRRTGPPEERTSALADGLDSDGGDSGGPRGRGRGLRRRTAFVIVVGVVLLVLAVWAITQGATLVGLGILVLYTPLVIATVIALRTAARA